MPSTSSLLKSAESTRQKIRDYNDALAAYEWQNSTKTYADFVAYSQYLESQQQSTSSPMDQLSYVKKIDSARSGYISNEIQRQSIRVIEGGGTNIDKYNRMVDLYYQAAGEGQYDLAQSLNLQLDNLSVTIQNEQRAALTANKEAASEYAKMLDAQVSDAVATMQSNVSGTLAEYQALGPDRFEQEYGTSLFGALISAVNNVNPDGTPNMENPGLAQIYQQAASLTTDPTKIREYQTKLDDLINKEGNTGIKLPGIKEAITYKDLVDQANAAATGQTLFRPVSTGQGTQLVRNNVTGYAWGRDATGAYKLMPIYNPDQDFTIDKSKKNGGSTYNDLLSKMAADDPNAGFQVIDGSKNKLVVRNNGAFDEAGIPRGTDVQMYVDLQGRLQFVSNEKAYTFNFDPNTAKFTGISADEANTINLLPSGNRTFSDFNNPYFAELQRNGKDLSSLPAGAIGLVDTTSPLARAMEAGPLAKPQFNPQQAGTIQQPARMNIQPVAPAPIQSAASPLGLPASTRISIAKPQPLPKLSVAKPAPTPTVSVAPPQQQQGRVSIGVAPSYGGTLRVGF